jgi:type II secretory pathway pseudopilin PulG
MKSNKTFCGSGDNYLEKEGGVNTITPHTTHHTPHTTHHTPRVRCKNFTLTKRQAHPSRFNSFLAFTLIEIVTVIAIIAIVLKISLATYGSIRQSAQKLEDQSKLKKIAAAWREAAIERKYDLYLTKRNPGVSYADYGTVYAFRLAGESKDARFYPSTTVLNDPGVYVSSGDRYASKVVKPYLVKGTGGEGSFRLENFGLSGITNGDFPLSQSSNGVYRMLWSYCAICNIPTDADLSTTPIAYTRGLQDDGLWDKKYGIYGSTGGFIAFADGHVKWFDGDKPVKLLRWDRSGYTHNIREAVPADARFGCGSVWNNMTGEHSKMVIWGDGLEVE